MRLALLILMISCSIGLASDTTNLYLPTACCNAIRYHADQSCVSMSTTTTCTQGISVNAAGEVRFPVVRQATCPTITTTDYMLIWVQEGTPNKRYLMFRENGDTVGVQLSPIP